MLDVEYASELLVLTVEGVTNKKDLLDDLYIEFEEEFPREADYEEEITTTLGLVRTLISDANRSQVKRKSNFYSLFGACLRYHRSSNRATFKNPRAIEQALTALLVAVHQGNLEGKPTEYVTYSEAVTRAASDKGRRADREDILFNLIEQSEATQN